MTLIRMLKNPFQESMLMKLDRFPSILKIIHLKLNSSMEKGEMNGENSDMRNWRIPEETPLKKQRENSKIKLFKEQT